MEHLLGMFGGGNEEPKDNQGGEGGAAWEYEMPLDSPRNQASADSEPAFSIPGGIPQEAVDVREETVEGYLQQLGWGYEKIDQGLWILKFKGGAKDYDIFVEITPQALVMVVAVLERVRDTCKEKLWYHILRLNYVLTSLRFGLNKRDEVLLTLETPISLISSQEFQKGLQYLCGTVDDAYPELLYLSQKPDAISSFMREMESSPPPPSFPAD